MKKYIFVILFGIITIITTIGVYLYNTHMHIETYCSPNGKYELLIKREQYFFTHTIPGDGGSGSISVEVILKDSDGNVIGTSSSNPDCAIFKDSIEVRWEIEDNEVWYGRGKTIDLNTGEVGC